MSASLYFKGKKIKTFRSGNSFLKYFKDIYKNDIDNIIFREYFKNELTVLLNEQKTGYVLYIY